MASLPPKVRDDLEYFDQEVEGEDVVLVRDPIRNTYFKFNPLQAAMLRELDGRKTPVEITGRLSEQFDVEIPPEAAERFIGRARELMLLDITSYRFTPEAARKQVAKALRKAGFRPRSSEPQRPRQLSAESTMFAEAFRQLELGHPRAAAGYLVQILEKNPNNARAKQLYDLIQSSFIRASGGLTDFPTWPLFDPSKMLTWMSRKLGWFFFSWIGILAMIAFCLVGVYAYTLVSFDRVGVQPLDIVIAFLFTTFGTLIHEVGHGLPCQHYGGNVNEIGFTLFYYMKLAAYCDTSSSYVIQKRSHKMIVQMGGTIASLLFISAHAMLLALLQPDLAIYPGLALALVIEIALTFVTLIPFMKFDGYYAICDYFAFPNLRDRSFKLLRASLSQRLLGVEVKTEDQPTSTRRWMIAFAVCSFAFTLLFVYVAYFRMLAPVVEKFRGPGLVFAVFITAYLLRNVAFKPLFELAKTIVRERRRVFTLRRVAACLVVAAVVIGPWFLQWPVLVDARFEVVPHQRADVRAQTPGRLETILVREGEHVKAGQPLATLRNVELTSHIAMLEAEHDAAAHLLELVRRGARPEELTLAREQLHLANAEVWRTSRDSSVAQKLAKAKLGTQSDADSARGKVASQVGAAGAAHAHLSLLEAGARPEEIAAAEAEVARIASELEHLRSDAALLVLRSPIDGVVATAHLEDKLQSMFAAGDLFVEVHDLSAVYAEITLSASDPLGEISVGDDVALRPLGAPGSDIRVRVDHLREAAENTNGTHKLVVVTAPFKLDRAVSGLTGHARIYGAERSLAYANLYLPLQRIVRVQLWSMW